MQPAAIALAIALFLFLLVQGRSLPLFPLPLLVPAIIFTYGLAAQDLPETPYDDEDGD